MKQLNYLSQNKMKFKTLLNSPRLWIKYFPWKRKDGHKYSRGRVVIYGGKKEFTGASILASEAALRTGSGSVKIICKSHTIHIYSIRFPSILKAEINNSDALIKLVDKTRNINWHKLETHFNLLKTVEMYEKELNVLLISDAGSEGLDLKRVRHIIRLSPVWHSAKNEQIIGRGQRWLSHADLPKYKRNVTVHKLIAKIPGIETEDEFMERKMERKKQISYDFINHLNKLKKK